MLYKDLIHCNNQFNKRVLNNSGGGAVSEPFLAEIRIVGFNFAPRGWAFCDGQLLPVAHREGQKSGEETHTLAANEMPQHDHVMRASAADGTVIAPQGSFLARATVATYTPPANLVDMNIGAVASVGGGQAHENMQPYLALNFCIALQGLFPSRN